MRRNGTTKSLEKRETNAGQDADDRLTVHTATYLGTSAGTQRHSQEYGKMETDDASQN
jgi:hypothetical protein